MKIKIVTLLFILFVLLITVIADLGFGEALFNLMDHVPGGDHTGHFFFMGILAFLVNLSLDGARVMLWGISLLKGSVIVTVLVTLEEFSQILLDERGFSLEDLAANYLGIVFFGWLAVRILARRNQQPAR